MGNTRHSGTGVSNGQVGMSSGFDAEAAEVRQTHRVGKMAALARAGCRLHDQGSTRNCMTKQYMLWGMPAAISSTILWFQGSPLPTTVCRPQKAQKEATAVKEQAASGSHEVPDPPLYRSDDFRMYCMKVGCSTLSTHSSSLVDAASAAAPCPCLRPCLCCHAAPWTSTKAASSRQISESDTC